jgi:hypothetical protein
VRILTDDELAAERAQVGRCTAERYDLQGVAEQELETILRARCES